MQESPHRFASTGNYLFKPDGSATSSPKQRKPVSTISVSTLPRLVHEGRLYAIIHGLFKNILLPTDALAAAN